MAYSNNQNPGGLETLTTTDSGDLFIVGDISDSNRVKTITETNLKADIFTSPTFTGTPIAPTAATSTDTTQIATTAFVKANATQFSTTNKFNGTCPTSFTDLDLSSVVGVAQKLVMLRIGQLSGSVTALTFKTKGDTMAYFGTNGESCGMSSVYLNSGAADNTTTIIVKTNTSGVIQWYGVDARTTTIDVLAYW